MNIHLKIKECVEKKGAEVIVTNTLVGMLDDEQVFADIESAPYKGILRKIIKDGYAQRLLDLGRYTPEIEFMASRYAQQSLTQQDSVQYILDSLAYALGWIDREPSIQPSEPKVNGDVVKPIEENPTIHKSPSIQPSGPKDIGDVVKPLKDNLSIPITDSKQGSLLNDVLTAFNKNKQKMFLFASMVLVVLGSLFLYDYLRQHADAESKIVDYSEVLNNLPGNYTLREKKDDIMVGSSKTAVLRNNASMYTFTIVTDFGPENHSFIITSNNLVSSETLGEGDIRYKENIKKTTITFKKDNYSWEFVK